MIVQGKIIDLKTILLFALTTCVFIFNQNSDALLGIPAYLWTNGLIGAFAAWSIYLCIKNDGKILWTRFYTFAVLFIVMCFVSIFYSYAPDASSGKTMTMVLVVIMSVFIYQYVVEENRLKTALKIYAWAGFIAAIYLLTASDISLRTLGDTGRLGGELGNENFVGITFVLSLTVAIHLLKTEEGAFRWIYLVQICIESVVVLFTGSRNAFVLLLAAVIFNLFLHAWQNHWNILRIVPLIIFVIVFLFLFYYAVMHIEPLYEVLGERLQSFVQLMRGEESSIGEGSTQMRGTLARRAFDWFRNSPLWLGHGIAAFASYNSTTFANGWNCYCHCGYLEILCGVGIPGFILFYFPFLGYIKSAFTNRLHGLDGEYCILLLVLTLEFLFGEILAVMYYEKATWILIGLLAGLYTRICTAKSISEAV